MACALTVGDHGVSRGEDGDGVCLHRRGSAHLPSTKWSLVLCPVGRCRAHRPGCAGPTSAAVPGTLQRIDRIGERAGIALRAASSRAAIEPVLFVASERYLVEIKPVYLFGQCSPDLFGQCSPLRPQPASSRPIDFFWHKGVAVPAQLADQGSIAGTNQLQRRDALARIPNGIDAAFTLPDRYA
jgi:hypothetical protein